MLHQLWRYIIGGGREISIPHLFKCCSSLPTLSDYDLDLDGYVDLGHVLALSALPIFPSTFMPGHGPS